MRRNKHHIGRLRIRAAAILTKGFGFEVLPSDIQPATGSNRTDWRQDVYRWELFTRNASGSPVVCGCWDTLTDFVKAAAVQGFHVDSDREINAGPEPPKP